MPHTRTPWSLQSKHLGNGQGTIGLADCPRSLHPEKCPKEVGALGFRCLPCFCHKLWVRKWPEWHHLPRWEHSPRPLQLTFRGPGRWWRSGEASVPEKVGAAPEIRRTTA